MFKALLDWWVGGGLFLGKKSGGGAQDEFFAFGNWGSIVGREGAGGGSGDGRCELRGGNGEMIVHPVFLSFHFYRVITTCLRLFNFQSIRYPFHPYSFKP